MFIIFSTIVLIILTYFIITATACVEHLTSMYSSVVITPLCYDRLIYDGTHYYLITARRQYDGITNPTQFNTLAAATKYLQQNACPLLPVTNLILHPKSHDDPTEIYERICSKHLAASATNKLKKHCNTTSDTTSDTVDESAFPLEECIKTAIYSDPLNTDLYELV